MRILLIGGTGTISMAVTKKIFQEKKHEIYLLNRGNHIKELPEGIISIICDIEREEAVKQALFGIHFDVVVDFIAFTPNQLERDYRLFYGKTDQFIFISSASAYQKPLKNFQITEDTPLDNPYWKYSRNKIVCEEFLMKKYHEEAFPVTIVRPSHTYDERRIPLGVHGENGSYSVIHRMLCQKPVIIHGDGTSLWVMTHSNDFAEAFVGLLGNTNAIGEAVQITGDEVLTWNQIYQIIADVLGVPLHPYYVASEFLDRCGFYDFKGSLLGDKSNSVLFENTKLKRLVPEFKQKIYFKEGIQNAVQYISTHPECQIQDPKFDFWCDEVIRQLDLTAESILKATTK